jgi:hypothetical protein
VVAGSGKRLFKDGDSLKGLNLLSTKPTRTGTVILTYQPRKARAKQGQTHMVDPKVLAPVIIEFFKT